MRAVVLTRFGGPEALVVRDVPVPRAGRGQVLVRVVAAALNPIDAKTRIGRGAARWANVQPPIVLGWDVSGVVEQVGEDVDELAVGTEVFGSIGFPGVGGTLAELAVADAAHVAPKPETVSHAQAAAAAMSGLTSWQALVRAGGVRAGQEVLVHAAAGGVGHVAVQVAVAQGARVVGTSSAANRDLVLSLGAERHVDYRATRFEDAVHDVDLVLDTVGGDTTRRSLNVVRPGGRVVTILPGEVDHDTDTAAHELGVELVRCLMRSDGQDMREVAALLAVGALRPVVSHQVTFEGVPEAHRLLDSRRTVGKIIVTP